MYDTGNTRERENTMNLQTMEYFSVLARERSFTRAAEALHITQQSLSGHIAAVEQELGAQLLSTLLRIARQCVREA